MVAGMTGRHSLCERPVVKVCDTKLCYHYRYHTVTIDKIKIVSRHKTDTN